MSATSLLNSETAGKTASARTAASATVRPATENPLSASLELGISGIPAKTCDLILGSLYALKASTSSARFPLFASLVLNAIRTGRRCVVITASKPDEFLSRLESHWSIRANDLIADGQLCVFSTQAEISKKIFRYGADRFVQELGSFNVKANTFLLYDQADDLLSLHDPFLAKQQVEVLAKWFQTNQVTALFSFSRPSERQSDTFNTLMDYFTGIARLGGEKNGLELTFLYWQATLGAAVASNFRLHTDEQGMYVAVEAAHSPSAMPASDRRGSGTDAERHLIEPATSGAGLCVIYNDAALDTALMSTEVSPLRASSVQEILSNACQQQNAMVLLNVAAITDFRKVAQVTHHIRLSLTSTMQLVVYGRQPDFSAEESQLLLRCGANAALSYSAVEGNLSGVINNIKRQFFARTVESDFSQLWKQYELELSAAPEPQTHAAQENPDESLSHIVGSELPAARVSQYAYINPRAIVPSHAITNNKKPSVRATRSNYAEKAVEENS